MYELALPLLIGLIAIALAFDFLNGLHDAANSIATVVATRLLSPGKAVAFAAFFNFAAYFLSLAVPQLHRVADTTGNTTTERIEVSLDDRGGSDFMPTIGCATGGDAGWLVAILLVGVRRRRKIFSIR